MNASSPSTVSQGLDHHDSGSDGSDFSGPWGIGLCFCSVLLHVALAVGFFFVQTIPPQRVLPPVIQVDLVALAFPGDAAAKTGGTVETAVPEERVISPPPEAVDVQPQAKTRETVHEPASAETIVVATRKAEPEKAAEPVSAVAPVRKLALKKKTFKADRVLANARKSIEKTAEIKPEKSAKPAPRTETTLEKAFSRLEKAVASQAGSRSAPGAGVSGVGATGDQTEYKAIDLYNVELMYRIRQNWAFNERLAKAEQGIEARVLIKILKNGQIRDVWFETRSGNRYLDESALKAVKKSNPLPPLPKGYVTYDVGLQFTPSGLK